MRHTKQPVSILPFRGFGSDQAVCVSAQVVFGRRKNLRTPRGRDERERLWRRLRHAFALAISRRVPNASVRIHCGGAVHEVQADSHGYLSTCMQLPAPQVSALWREYLVELLEPEAEEAVSGRGEILVATPSARRVIVSDIDDTVVFTGVSNKLKMLWRLFAHDAQDRVPFPGVAPLYRGLFAGPGGEERNPLIYLSRSPWSIYPTLEEFFQLHEIPAGPVLQLRDWGINLRHPYPRRARTHKRDVLERVIAVFPEDLPLVLLGDSGQRDPELYTALARRYPGRVAAIYIRDLRLKGERTTELARLQGEMALAGIPLVFAATSQEMALDLAARGWIGPADLEQVHQSLVHDEP